MVVPAFAAERRAAIDKYFSSTEHTAANGRQTQVQDSPTIAFMIGEIFFSSKNQSINRSIIQQQKKQQTNKRASEVV